MAALRRWAMAEPDRPAYHLLGEGNQIVDSLSYGQLDRRAQTIAAQIAKRQLPSGACVLALYPEGLDFIAAFMGCLYAGVVAVPAPFAGKLRSARDEQRLRAIVADSQAALILTTTAGSRAMDLPAPLLTTDAPDKNDIEAWEPVSDERGVAYIQYTSGSTAAPKGIAVTHINLSHSLADLHQAWGYAADSAVLTWMPHVHDFGLVEGLLRPLSSGVPCFIMSPWAFVRRPVRWLEAISRYRITHSGGATFAYDWCVRQIRPEQRPGLDLHSWQVAVIGAEPIQPAVIERFVSNFSLCGFHADTFCPGYGLAEVTLLATAKSKGLSLSLRDLMIGAHMTRLTGCGQPHGQGRVLVIDPEACRPCKPGEVGEIWIDGPTVAAGYWQRPDETRATFEAYLADSNEGPFLRTGDLGLMDHGELFITGRLKDMLIIRGQNLYPQDIEWALAGCHPAVEGQLTAVFGIPSEAGEQIVVAQEVDPRHWPEATWGSVIAAIRQRVAEQFDLPMQGAVLLRRGDLPKTSSGKIQRHACRAAYLVGEWSPVAAWQQPITDEAKGIDRHNTDLTTRLIVLWQALLQAPVCTDDNFFALGGDSLTALHMLLEVEEQFGVQVDPEFFQSPTVANLVRLLSPEQTVPSTQSAVNHKTLSTSRPRLPRKRRFVERGPLFRRHALPYGLGVRLQRAWLATPGVRHRLFRREIELLNRWGDLVGEQHPEAAIRQSLLANTWVSWRNQVLSVPLGTSSWVAMQGDPALWQPRHEGRGIIFLVLHSELSVLFVRSLTAGGHQPLFIRGWTGDMETRTQDRSLQVYRAYQSLRRGEAVIIAGDGGHGPHGV
ncbi:MAG: AMP-binding protein, partial [Thermoflexales bacterium]|nr:AMP-binding protein [Thermoflexales bacterium]